MQHLQHIQLSKLFHKRVIDQVADLGLDWECTKMSVNRSREHLLLKYKSNTTDLISEYQWFKISIAHILKRKTKDTPWKKNQWLSYALNSVVQQDLCTLLIHSF